MNKDKLIEDRLELSGIIGCAVNEWEDICEECHKEGYAPTDTMEECIADSVLAAGYRKQSEGVWVGVWDYECSVCNEYHDIKTKFCPNCGARMKGA